MNPQASDLFENQHDRFIEEQLFAIHSERQFEINPSGFLLEWGLGYRSAQ